MHAVVQHADGQEHGARNEAVRNHLHQPALHAHVGKQEKAQGDEAHMRDRRVRHELLHVVLHQGDEADVDHRDQRQGDDDRRQQMTGVWQHGQGKADETVGAQLEHDGRQHHRASGRGLDVRVGQPGMHRPHRNLDREGEKEGDEYEHLRSHRQRHVIPVGDVEAAARLQVEINERHQHEQRAQQGVEEELECRVDPPWPTPDPDDQVHGNQRGLEKHIEQHRVGGGEHTDHQA
ncbi:hypothetical protein GALL_461710 [mine drainage metagenome]|uniref:Uncharacterized protein n=1 Tax=mine drainage metagenome TaxID=410659 RepID=A0A1J5PWK5_9ZZZZ